NPVRVIGNIPYNITTPIIFWLIEQLDYWDDAFLMVQKEVANRLVAQASTKSYGKLTVVVGAYLDIESKFTIPPDVFIPKPKVDSAFIHLTKKPKPLIEDKNYIKFNKIVSTAFNQRRKMLKNSMKSWDFSDQIIEKIDFSRRPETLSIKEFVSLIE
ncbi:MAG: rRNA adenine dimethyltransferase family protein, partial [Candidatus Neomarinimicrobiota bacterium]|nr:rRNA adenine dimethyltransferase family protein [Candidatus Neomarinimicrobiota bacterium]